MKFVGTGAGEGIPTPFCRCEICQNARKVRGKEIRMRSCFRVAEDLQIDFGPDTFAQSVMYENDLFALEHLLVTHTHEDHFSIFNLFLKTMISRGSGKKLNVYLTGDAFQLLEAFERVGFNGSKEFFQDCLHEHIIFHRLEFWEEHQIGEYFVTPIQGAHHGHFEKYSANYIITLPNRQKMLYALDTGYYSKETLDFLKNVKLDFFMIESTYGNLQRGNTPYSHLDMNSVNYLTQILYQQNTISDATYIFLTHINQEQGFTHEQMTEFYDDYETPYEMYVAYDGMMIDHLLK
ncbi:MAG: MBL fold metallo-hydrolase [Anaerocolumna sp.]